MTPLAAEELRDALLQAAGALELPRGGPPVWPPLPDEVLQANPAFLDDNKEKTKGWYPSPEHQQFVRSIYLVRKRTVKVPFLEQFDLPDNAVSCAVRERSIVAPQALTLLNDALVETLCLQMAKRIDAAVGSDPAPVVRMAFEVALSRSPDAAEQTLGEQYLQRHSPAELCRALVNTNEFYFLD